MGTKQHSQYVAPANGTTSLKDQRNEGIEWNQCKCLLRLERRGLIRLLPCPRVP